MLWSHYFSSWFEVEQALVQSHITIKIRWQPSGFVCSHCQATSANNSDAEPNKAAQLNCSTLKPDKNNAVRRLCLCRFLREVKQSLFSYHLQVTTRPDSAWLSFTCASFQWHHSERRWWLTTTREHEGAGQNAALTAFTSSQSVARVTQTRKVPLVASQLFPQQVSQVSPWFKTWSDSNELERRVIVTLGFLHPRGSLRQRARP